MKTYSTAERLRYLMETRGIKQIDIFNSAYPIAKESGVKLNRSNISQYVSGAVKPTSDKLIVLGKALNVDPSWLMGMDVPMAPQDDSTHSTPDIISTLSRYPELIPIRGRHMVPLLGEVACGEPIFSPNINSEYINAGEDIQCDCALIARGDSMTGDRIHSGDMVYINTQIGFNDGDIVAVAIDDEVTLKHVHRMKDANGNVTFTHFISSNPTHPPIIVGGEHETRSVHVIGRAVAFRGVL